MFKVRNVIEAGVLASAIGLPVLFLLPYSLTTRIIILCLTALPAAMLGLMGISGEPLSSFLIILIRFVKNRRILGGESANRKRAKPPKIPGKEKKPQKKKAGKYERRPSEKTEAQQDAQKQVKPEPPEFLNPVAE